MCWVQWVHWSFWPQDWKLESSRFLLPRLPPGGLPDRCMILFSPSSLLPWPLSCCSFLPPHPSASRLSLLSAVAFIPYCDIQTTILPLFLITHLNWCSNDDYGQLQIIFLYLNLLQSKINEKQTYKRLNDWWNPPLHVTELFFRAFSKFMYKTMLFSSFDKVLSSDNILMT